MKKITLGLLSIVSVIAFSSSANAAVSTAPIGQESESFVSAQSSYLVKATIHSDDFM